MCLGLMSDKHRGKIKIPFHSLKTLLQSILFILQLPICDIITKILKNSNSLFIKYSKIYFWKK